MFETDDENVNPMTLEYLTQKTVVHSVLVALLSVAVLAALLSIAGNSVLALFQELLAWSTLVAFLTLAVPPIRVVQAIASSFSRATASSLETIVSSVMTSFLETVVSLKVPAC